MKKYLQHASYIGTNISYIKTFQKLKKYTKIPIEKCARQKQTIHRKKY